MRIQFTKYESNEQSTAFGNHKYFYIKKTNFESKS